MIDIHQQEDTVMFKFKGTHLEAAQLRKKFMTQLSSYAIHKVTFLKNKTAFTYEDLAYRFGLLIVDYASDKIGSLNFKGPGMLYCHHIKGITFIHDSPITYLNENEHLKCDLFVEEGTGKQHGKWNPVAAIRFMEVDNYFQFKFELTGQLPLDEMIKQLK